MPVVYDGVGRDTFVASLDSLAPLGMFVSFGNASGPVSAFEPALLAQRGSLFFTRPTLATYTSSVESLRHSAQELFGAIATASVKISSPIIFALEQAAVAHSSIQSRATTGSIVLRP